MIDRFIERLHDAGLDLSEREIAESFWLARYLPMTQRRGLETTQEPRSASPSKVGPESPLSAPEVETPPLTASPGMPVPEAFATLPPLRPQPSALVGDDNPLELRSPSASALPHKLALARVLRPLRRQVACRVFATLDEVATAERIAEQGLWVPVLRPARRRWLDAILVVDQGRSMAIWRKTLLELKRLLQGQGAFRDVRAWEMDTNSTHGFPRLRPMGSSGSFNRSSHELMDARGRRLILVASDCVSPAWHSGAVSRTLGEWGRYGPVVLIQMLPRSLWGRTSLRRAAAAEFHSRFPGLPNRELDSKALGSIPGDASQRFAIPVVTLEKNLLGRWARMVAGRPGAWAPGALLSLKPMELQPSVTVLETKEPSVAPNAAERLRRFRGTASPTAQILAGLLASTPLSLPVMRLVWQTMLPESEQVHLAEFFLGGLIHEVRSDKPPKSPDEVRYDFHDGVRELLLETVPTGNSLEVLRRTSRFMEKRLGQSFDFRAILSEPGVLTAREVWPFAHVSAKVLRRLGGEYSELADRLEQRIPLASEPAIESATAHAQESTVVSGNDSLPTRDAGLEQARTTPSSKGTSDVKEEPSSPSRGALVWSKNLSASDAQRVKKGSNPVGGIRLTQARFEVGGVRIDQTRYFRYQLFGRYKWGNKSKRPYVESTVVPFEVVILGERLGLFELEVSHKPSGEAGQNNYTTILHLRPLMDYFRVHDLRGRVLNLYAPPTGKEQPFSIDIS